MKRFLTQDVVPLKMNKVQLESKKRLEKAISEGLIRLVPRENCICGSIHYEKIAHIDRFGLDFPCYVCKKCGVVFTSPHISENSLSLYYQEYYHPLTFGTDKPLDFLFSKHQGRKIFGFMKDILKNKTLRTFELGAGSGSNLLEFSQVAGNHGYKVIASGIEFNENYVLKGKKKGINLTSMPLEEFTVKISEKFDVIILSHVLEHCTDIQKTIKSLMHISHPETLFYIEVPGILDLKNKHEYNCDFLQYLTHAHIFNFSLNSLRNTLNMCGLKLVSGNEKLESLFKIGKGIPVPEETPRNYEEIIAYLNDLEDNLAFYQSKNPAYSLFGRMKKKVRAVTDYFMEKI